MKLTTVHINCPNPSGEGKETEHTGTAESIFAKVAKLNERCSRSNAGYHKFTNADVYDAFLEWERNPSNLAKANIDMW